MLQDKSLSDRLACIALLHAYNQSLKIINSMHVRMAIRINNKRLAGNEYGAQKSATRSRSGVIVVPEAMQS